MNTVLIKNAKIVNEGSIFEGDVLIQDEFIVEIGTSINPSSENVQVIDANGSF